MGMKTITIKQINKIINYLTNILRQKVKIWSDSDMPNKRVIVANERYIKKLLADITSNKKEQHKIRNICESTNYLWWGSTQETIICEQLEKIGYVVISK